ncbi:tRNA 2-selenouridine(34) synthase MnmH [Geopsychrobacter electrodiphilus]|uniref:tRNA 2-selenouridine(34) synthase MnmH n=1 Tax=Geopsychrobacter electrodiphilus TaxID=225196 RepID=UPI001FE1B101|nr:tRNA 2-selenouridine(34) synthase MnmH [Geopsychrobacter electrodiphilus]
MIDLEKALKLRQRGALFVDVRSPAEFAEATIPGAINVPIFDNEERAEIGTLYKQTGRKDARRRGIEIVSPKIPQIMQQIETARDPNAPPVVVFCWRGGQRSLAITTFLSLAGIPAHQLAGGHKVFRRRVIDYFEQTDFGRVLVVRGLTGVGKTLLLKRLEAAAYPVIDLEGLANHRGSAFGGLGLGDQPGQVMFEARLWERLQQCQGAGYLLTEGESRHIGRLVVPPRFHLAMQQEVSLWVDASLDYRVRVILEDYPALDDLTAAFEPPLRALKERLGKQAVEDLLGLLAQKKWEELTRRLMVDYYDPLYLHTCPPARVEIRVETLDAGVEDLKQAILSVLASKA